VKRTEVRKAVFPAAGLGTRFLPATKAQPKEMLPLVDKPLIQYAVEEAAEAGLGDVILVTGRGKSAMEDHFDLSVELERMLEARGKLSELKEIRRVTDLASVAYVRQKEALGLGHAVLVARPLVGDEPFAVFLSDDVIRARVPCMRQLLDVYADKRASVLCIEPVTPEQTSSYGIIAGEQIGDRLYRVTDLVEKPSPADAPSLLGIIGRYVLTPRIFDMIEQTAAGAGGEIQLTDALRRLLREEPIYAYAFEGKRYDAGSKLGFLQATVELALDRADLGKPFHEYLRSLGV
jgi:UTP--glucose-1-phosphate uridylyltransferase